LNDKKLVKSGGNSCSYLGETQQCSEWCTEQCGAPCSICELASGNECACDEEAPALNDKKLAKETQGFSCSYLGETQECATWCTENCGAPCSACYEGANDVVCECDEVPALNDKKLVKGSHDEKIWIKADGNSCVYLGETQQCSEWCTDTCGAPCSACQAVIGAACTCDEVPALNDIAIKNGVKVKSAGNSCSYLGETHACSDWCTDNCGAPCSACEEESGNVCACDEVPALNGKKL